MPQGFSELVKVYIENLNLSQETKKQLLESNPKTLEDVSMWLKNTQKSQQKDKESSFNPFSANTKLKLTEEIKLFSNNKTFNTNLGFDKDSLVDTDDASWGLSIDKSQSDSVTYYSNNTPVQGQRTYSTEKIKKTNYSQTESTDTKNNTTSSTTNNDSTTRTPEQQVQDNAIASIRENVNTSIETVIKQMEEQGIISSAYNSLKEYFDSQMGLSSVCRVIYSEKNTADLLQKAQDKKLTKEEYWKTKISTAIDMMAGNRELTAEERACLEERLSEFTPEELNALIDKIKYANNEEYEKLNSNLDKYIEEGRNLLSRNRSDSNSTEINTNPNSIKSLMKTADAKELMTFEEVWKAERGVDFDPQAIEEYEEAAAQYAMVSIVSNKAENIHNILKDSMTLVKGNNQNGVDQKTRETGEKQLETQLITALKTLYGDDEVKINEELQKFSNNTISYKDGQIVYNEFSKNNKGYYLLDAAQKLLDKVDENVQKIKGPYAIEYYAENMASAYERAYGRKNATQLARAFVNDQEEIVGKVRSGVEYVGAGVMVAGMFFCPPAALAGALTASFGGIGVEALNESTRKEGMTEEAKKKITEELMTNAALFAVGGAASKMGTATKAALLAEKCPTLMACIADIGVDATISLLGDLALTGEIDIEAEGISQLISVIAGHVRAAKFGKNSPSRQDLYPSNNPAFNKALENLKRTDPQLYKDFQLLRSKNLLPENFGSIILNPSNSTLNPNLKKEITLLADCIRKGIDPKDAFVPKRKSLEEAAKLHKTGEVFSLEGTNDVYIMDESGPIKLDMDRDMYFSLFPPLKTYCTSQGAMGDCYFVSTILDGAMNNPIAKVQLLKMFHQKGNDIIIDFKEYSPIDNKYRPSDYYDNCPSQIVFKDAKKRMSVTANEGAESALGLQLIEEAYGYKLAAMEIADCLNDLNIPADKQKQIYEELQKVFADDSYKPSKEFIEILEKAFDGEVDFIGSKTYKDESGRIKSLKTKILIALNGIDALRQKSIGNGGQNEMALKNFFGLDDDATQKFSTSYVEEAHFIEFLQNCQNNPNIILTAGSLPSESNSKKIIEQLSVLFGLGDRGKHLISSQHAYRIHSFDCEKKTISIVNPWNTAHIITISFEEFKKYFSYLYATDISKTTDKKISQQLVQKIQELGINTKSANGRNYTNEELIDKYLEKLKNEKNIEPPSVRALCGDDELLEDIYDNKAVVALHNKIVEKYGNARAESIIRALCQINDQIYDKEFLDKLVKNLEALLENPDIEFEVAYKIATTIHSNYSFVIEKAPEILLKLKEKGYSSDVAIKIVQSITPENFEDMKKFWE